MITNLLKVIDYFSHLTGNFGLAILIITVLVKLIFFPLANKSYASMAKTKAVQPEMANIRERDFSRFCRALLRRTRFTLRRIALRADDKMKQQTALNRALQEGEDQPARRLPADRDPDPGVLLAHV